MPDLLAVLEVRTGPDEMPYLIAQVEWDGDPGDRPWVRIRVRHLHDGVTERYTLRGSTEQHPGDGIIRTYVDPQIPLNSSVTYVVQWASDPAIDDWQEVPWDGLSVANTVATPALGRLQILSHPGEVGQEIRLPLSDNSVPRQTESVGSLIRVQGRSRPVALWDVRTSETGQISLIAKSSVDVRQIERLIEDGAPILSRRGMGSVPHTLPPREIVHPGSVSRRRIVDGVTQVDIDYTVVDDPEPGQVASVGTFDDMQAAIDAVDDPATIDDFDDIADYWVGLGLVTFANVAAYDWWTEANSA